jgi:hypothetical protein
MDEGEVENLRLVRNVGIKAEHHDSFEGAKI